MDDYDDDIPQPSPLRRNLLVVGSLIGACVAGLAVFAIVAASRQAPSPAPVSRPIRPATPRESLPAFREPVGEAEAVAGGFAGLTCFAVSVAGVIGYVVGVILLMAWVAKDARARGVDGGAVWVLVILFTNVVGLLVYMASRPHGVLVTCGRCGNRKLMAAMACPHCGARAED